MKCKGETCTCLVDGAKTGECQADGICMDTTDIEAKGTTCCGF